MPTEEPFKGMGDKILTALFSLVFGALLTIYAGFLLAKFWNWFTPETYPRLLTVTGVGIKICWDLLMVSPLLYLTKDKKLEEKPLSDVFVQMVTRALMYTVGWGYAWVLKEVLL